MGVPVRLGKEGVEEIIEIDLDADEQEQLANSAAAVKELVEAMASLWTRSWRIGALAQACLG